jgi:uncharacterized protein YndB with AHSA1/START domain
MAKIVASVVIDRPVEEVWKFVMDLSKLPKWNTGIQEAKQTSSGPIGVGTALQTRSGNMVVDIKVIEFEPGRKLTMEFTSGPVKGSMETSTVENVEGKTRFTRMADSKFSGVYKLVGPFLTSRFKREYLASVGNLKRILESEAKS